MSGLGDIRPLVLCGPSGSGKSTLLNRMMKDFPDKFGFSVSHTTRKPRPGEIDGQHYHFSDLNAMRKAVQEGKFIESTTFSGNMYGTSKIAVEAVAQLGKVCVLDIDVRGVQNVKETDLNPWYVFINPPSVDALKDRLLARKTETEESLQQRLKIAKEEIAYGTTPGNFDIIIVNDDLDHAYAQLKAFLEEKVI